MTLQEAIASKRPFKRIGHSWLVNYQGEVCSLLNLRNPISLRTDDLIATDWKLQERDIFGISEIQEILTQVGLTKEVAEQIMKLLKEDKARG